MTTKYIEHYGFDKQLEKLREEAIELAHAIQKYQADKGSLDDVKEEMADNLNLITQFNEYFNDGELYKIIFYKRERQDKRIKGEKVDDKN